jgi:hypothetical protein
LHRTNLRRTSSSDKLMNLRILVLGLLLLSLFFVVTVGAASRFEQPALTTNVVQISRHCSGFILPKNIVITARHCVSENIVTGSPVKVVFYDGLEADFNLIGYGEAEDSRDFAILRGDTRGFTPWQISETIPEKGSICAHVGHGGGSPRQLLGVCRVIGLDHTSGYIELAGAVIGGDSGSAVFDYETQKVFGIIVRSSYPVPTVLVVPIYPVINEIRKLLNEESIY